MTVFAVIFGKAAKLPTEGTAPYALMVFVGMLTWTFFATALSEASGSLINNVNLISKVYFPRLIVPTATVVVAFTEFLISFVILAGMMVWYQFLPSCQIIFLPVFTLLVFLASLRPGLWHTALNVKYRDFRFIIPLIVPFGLYTPPLVSLLALSLSNIASSTPSTSWSPSSTASAGTSSAARPYRLDSLQTQRRCYRLLSPARHPAIPQNEKEHGVPYLKKSKNRERRTRKKSGSSRWFPQ